MIAESLQLFGDRSAIDRRLVGDQSATKNCVGIVCNRCNWSAIGRQPVGDLSATRRRPPKTFLRSIWSQRGFTCSNQNLLAIKSSLQPVGDWSPTSLQPPCNLPATTRNFGRKEVADRLQAMCDRGFRTCLNCQYDCQCNVKGPGHQQLWLDYYDFIVIWWLMQVPITYAWVVYVQKPGTCTLKHCHKYMWNKKHWGERRPRI